MGVGRHLTLFAQVERDRRGIRRESLFDLMKFFTLENWKAAACRATNHYFNTSDQPLKNHPTVNTSWLMTHWTFRDTDTVGLATTRHPTLFKLLMHLIVKPGGTEKAKDENKATLFRLQSSLFLLWTRTFEPKEQASSALRNTKFSLIFLDVPFP